MKNDYLNTLEENDMLIKENFEYDFEKQRMFSVSRHGLMSIRNSA